MTLSKTKFSFSCTSFLLFFFFSFSCFFFLIFSVFLPSSLNPSLPLSLPPSLPPPPPSLSLSLSSLSLSLSWHEWPFLFFSFSFFGLAPTYFLSNLKVSAGEKHHKPYHLVLQQNYKQQWRERVAPTSTRQVRWLPGANSLHSHTHRTIQKTYSQPGFSETLSSWTVKFYRLCLVCTGKPTSCRLEVSSEWMFFPSTRRQRSAGWHRQKLNPIYGTAPRTSEEVWPSTKELRLRKLMICLSTKVSCYDDIQRPQASQVLHSPRRHSTQLHSQDRSFSFVFSSLWSTFFASLPSYQCVFHRGKVSGADRVFPDSKQIKKRVRSRFGVNRLTRRDHVIAPTRAGPGETWRNKNGWGRGGGRGSFLLHVCKIPSLKPCEGEPKSYATAFRPCEAKYTTPIVLVHHSASYPSPRCLSESYCTDFVPNGHWSGTSLIVEGRGAIAFHWCWGGTCLHDQFSWVSGWTKASEWVKLGTESPALCPPPPPPTPGCPNYLRSSENDNSQKAACKPWVLFNNKLNHSQVWPPIPPGPTPILQVSCTVTTYISWFYRSEFWTFMISLCVGVF